VLKSNENIEVWHFRRSQLANSSKLYKNSFFEDIFKVSAPSFYTSSKSFDSVWPCWWNSVADHPTMSARLSSTRRRYLAWVYLICLKFMKY